MEETRAEQPARDVPEGTSRRQESFSTERLRVSFGELVAVATITTAVVSTFDVANGAVLQFAEMGLDWRDVFAPLHLLAWMLPVALVAAVGAWALGNVVRATPWLDGIRERVADPRRWIAPDPDGVATILGAVVALGAYAGGLFLATGAVERVFASERFQHVGVVGASFVLAFCAVLVAATVALPVRAVGRRIPKVARLGPVVLVLVVLGIVVGAVLRARFADNLGGQTWRRVIAGPVVLGAISIAWLVVRPLATRLRPTRKASRIFAVATTGAAVLALLASAFTYGAHRTRELLEGRSIYGLTLYRVYVKLADRDRDGYAGLFGGWDCDDGDSAVHPGAEDRRGDGVDSDCFGGDGTLLVAPLGNGRFGTVPSTRNNVLLVTVDALRADAIGAYGGRRRTPNIDQFAASATRFSYAVTSSSRTVTAMPSMMTGLYGSQLERGPEYFYPSVLASNEMLAERLKRAGYGTMAIAGTRFFSRIGGYFQGFDTVQQVTVDHSPRPWPVDRAIEHLDAERSATRPWFMWVHLFNTHAEYLEDGAPSRYGNDPRGKYDTEVALADEQIGRLLHALSERGLDSRTVVVLAADHGEAFGEHGTDHHEHVFEEELRVPLIIRVPGLSPRRAPEPVSTVDIAPTIMNLAGIAPDRPIAGWSLVPVLTGQARPAEWNERYLVSERLPDGWATIHELVLRKGRVRLTWYADEDRFELHDLTTDPRQLHNIADEREDVTWRMAAYLRAWLWQTGSATSVGARIVARNRLPAAPKRMTRTLGLRYPFFVLLGYDLPRTTYRRGEVIRMTFYYKVLRRTDESARFRIEFGLPSNVDVLFFQGEHEPLQGFYPTTQWRPGEILRDEVAVPVPTFIPATLDVPVRLRVGISGEIQFYEGQQDAMGWLALPTIHIRG